MILFFIGVFIGIFIGFWVAAFGQTIYTSKTQKHTHEDMEFIKRV